MGGCATKVSLGAVSVDGLVQAFDSRVGVVVAVGLEGVDKGIRCVIRLVELICLDISCLLKGLSRLDIWFQVTLARSWLGARHGRHTLLLHLEGVAGLDVEVRGILVLLFSSTKEAKSLTGARKSLVGLY